jgi:hypothetical protein
VMTSVCLIYFFLPLFLSSSSSSYTSGRLTSPISCKWYPPLAHHNSPGLDIPCHPATVFTGSRLSQSLQSWNAVYQPETL